MQIVALAVLLDPVGEVAQAPVLVLGHLAAMLGDHAGVGVGQGLGLLRREVLPRDEGMLVRPHNGLLLLEIDRVQPMRNGAVRARHRLSRRPRRGRGDPGLRIGAHYTKKACARQARLTGPGETLSPAGLFPLAGCRSSTDDDRLHLPGAGLAGRRHGPRAVDRRAGRPAGLRAGRRGARRGADPAGLRGARGAPAADRECPAGAARDLARRAARARGAQRAAARGAVRLRRRPFARRVLGARRRAQPDDRGCRPAGAAARPRDAGRGAGGRGRDGRDPGAGAGRGRGGRGGGERHRRVRRRQRQRARPGRGQRRARRGRAGGRARPGEGRPAQHAARGQRAVPLPAAGAGRRRAARRRWPGSRCGRRRCR